MDRFKNYAAELLTFIIIFFSPVKAAIFSVIVLALFDFVTGLAASRKKDQPWTSRRAYSSIVKVTMYSVLILASHLMETHLIDFLPLVKLATSSIAMVELKSLYENISITLGIDLWKALKNVMDRKLETDEQSS